MNRRLFIYSWPLSSCDSKKWAKNLPSFFLIPNPQVMSTCVESSQCNYVILHQNPLWSSYNVCEQGLTCLRDWVHPRISQLISTLLRKLSNWAVVSCSSWPDWKVDFYLGTSWTQVWSTNGQRSATLIISMIWYSSPSRCRRAVSLREDEPTSWPSSSGLRLYYLVKRSCLDGVFIDKFIEIDKFDFYRIYR
jgi:hypothetical protein